MSDQGEGLSLAIMGITALSFGPGYLLGSVPFGLILTKLAGYGDIRKIGSGNIGATNVLRTGNKKLALLTLLLDGGKGAAAVLLCRYFLISDFAVVAGFGALIGHMYSIFLRFRGGKGVATAIGIYLALAWPIGVAICLLWLITALIFRYSSLAALVAMAAVPALYLILPHCEPALYPWLLSVRPVAWISFPITVLIWFKHRANIRRLLAGTEPKIGQKNAPA